jgi:hypothetical protein
MSHTAVAVADVPSLVLAGAHAEVPPVERTRPNPPGASRRMLGWVKEGLLLVAVAYAFPLAILAIGIPVALTINGLLIAASWAWKAI